MKGRSCSPKHDPRHFTVLKNLFVWMVWNFSKTLELMAGLCFPKHGPVLFTVLKILFVLMFGSHVKTFKLMVGPRSPTSLVTAQLISRRWRIVSFWCCADFHYCSNERMVVPPQTRSNSFHGVDDFFYRVGMKLFKIIRTYGWVVLPQTRPSFFHGVEKPFRLIIKRSSLWLGRAPQHPLSRPSLFRGVEESFRFDVCANTPQRSNERLFKNIRANGWAVLFQTRPSFIHGVEELLLLDVMQACKNIQVHGWAAFSNILIHGPADFAALKNRFVLMLCRH